MLIVRGMTETCSKSECGEHNWTGYGDPRYMWCFACQQEKPSNMEFIAWNTEVQAQLIVTASEVNLELVEINGEQVHLATRIE